MKTISIKPITSYLDLRSNPADVPAGGYRYVTNMAVETKLRLCRMPGWTKLLDSDYTNNSDWHDQLESITGVSGRRPVTFIFEASSTNKTKALLIGNDRVLATLMLGTKQFRIISDQLGADGITRWYATQNLDTVVLTNDYDGPVYWSFDAPPAGVDNQSVAPIDDLVTLGITRVGVVVTWSGSTFFMNVVEKGTAKTHAIYWSDYEKPLSLIPSDNSIAGNSEVDSQESILAAMPLGNVLLIYTTLGIWELSNVGGEEVFGVARRYNPQKSGEACLAYKNSLVSIGDEHLYLGSDGIYSYSIFDSKPKLPEWIHRASSVIYDNIDKTRCDWQIAKYNPNRREVWFSWVDEGEELPLESLVCNTTFPFSSIVDYGFTAFGYFQPNEPVTTLSQWILENCICDSYEYAEVFGALIKEGGQCIEPEPTICADEDQPDSFFTTTELELEDGIVMEDWDAVEASENSLCNRLAGTTISSLCVEESKRDQCNAGRLFVMASASDLCLKQMSDVFYREEFIGYATYGNPCGTYEQRGYKSILRSGPLNFKDVSNEKQISRFAVDAIAAASVTPGEMAIRIGVSSMPNDPNDATCSILWFSEAPKTLDCIAKSAATHAANATRPDEMLEWPTYAIGNYLYYELTIQNPDSTPIDVGASVCMSGYLADVDAVKTRR